MIASSADRLTEGLNRTHLPALDGLRGIAVMLVIFYHSGAPVPGGLGVLIFFVLSGFLITWLLLKEWARHDGVSLRGFYARRTLRIFPAFYAYATASLILMLAIHKAVDWHQFAASLFYANNYYQAIRGDPNTMLSHTWSLAIEEQFYLLWPFTFAYVLRKNVGLARSLMGGIGVIWCYRLFLVFGLHISHGYIYEAFDTRADSLLIGCLLAVVLWEGRAKTAVRFLCNGPIPAAITAFALVASIVAEMRIGSMYVDSVGFALDSVLVAALIVQLVAAHRSFGAWLNWRWLTYLGALSYSLYLYQQIAISPAERFATRFPAIFRMPIIVAVVLVCAAVSYYLIERPALNIKDMLAAHDHPFRDLRVRLAH